MIQRKQTIFLFLAVVFGVLSLCMQLATVSFEGLTTYRIFSLWALGQNNTSSFIPCPLFILMLLSTTLSACTIFLYKRRPLQARLCMVNIFIMVLWYVSMIVVSKQLAPDAANFRLEIASRSRQSSRFCFLWLAREFLLMNGWCGQQTGSDRYQIINE